MMKNLVLITPVKLEDVMVDFLLGQDQVTRFASAIVDAHGTDLKWENLGEQVRGRDAHLRFEILLAEQALPALFEQLTQRFNGVGITWFVLPVLAQGVL